MFAAYRLNSALGGSAFLIKDERLKEVLPDSRISFLRMKSFGVNNKSLVEHGILFSTLLNIVNILLTFF